VKTTIDLVSNVQKTARLLQMSSMFDLPMEEKLSLHWDHDLPVEDRDWSVGLIVGPSGAGKSVLANRLWPDRVLKPMAWDPNRTILDNFPEEMPVRDITGLLTSVGLGSVPTWARPFHTLSNGEAFRAEMARAMAEDNGLLVVDEFTSVVDRQVARVASHTLQKSIRRAGRQMVAVTCHYDVEEWLQPDWVYDVAASKFTWRLVQPHPRLNLGFYEVDKSAWRVFARHHYLSGELSPGAKCFGAFIGDECVAFAAYIHFAHPKTRNIKTGHRLVVLPDYQGLGIGGRMDDWLGQKLWSEGFRYRNITGHPAMIRYYKTSPRWHDMTPGRQTLQKTIRDPKSTALSKTLRSKSNNDALRRRALDPRRLNLRSFEYTPPEES
jgi:GNAT superfamily N-acetyltransferase